MSDSDKRLFLLDAYALIFRAYFAFARNPRISSKGVDTSAIFGFTTTLLEVLEKEKPSHIAVVFDMPSKTVRHEVFPEYKANRNETPEAIKVAVPIIYELLKAFNIPALGVDGYEADDVIGTLAKEAEREGYTTFMMTPDKDFGQLVTENIKMYRPGRGGNPAEVWGPKEVCEKFQIKDVSQVIDFLGMMGDAVDNIPGLPGVGEKTAQKLLAEYGSLENTLEHADEIKGKLGEKIRNNAEQGKLSKSLATIITDVPIDFDEKSLTRDAPDQALLQKLFDELEFRTLSKRVFAALSPNGETTESPQVNNPGGGQMDLFAAMGAVEETPTEDNGHGSIESSPHLYQLIQDIEGVKLLSQKLLKQKEVAWDTETTGLDPWTAELVGISFSFGAGKAYYVHFPESRENAEKYLALLKPFFESEVLKIGQNLKYDISVLMNYGVKIQGPFFDTLLAHYLIEPDQRHKMDVLAEVYLNYRTVPIEDLIGKKGKKQLTMRDVPAEKIAAYAGEDADITFRLKQKFEVLLKEEDLEKVFKTIELPLIEVLTEMEFEGVKVDTSALKSLSQTISSEVVEIEKKIFDLADQTFNIASPKQLGEVLFEKMKLVEKPKKTKTGQYATGEEILEGLRGKHEIIDLILEFRQLVKLQNTYVDALPELVNPKTGRIHTTFNQTVAATGRLSSVNPNLQNIPIRSPRGQEVRKAFVPASDRNTLLAADYSQIELRIIAALSKDKSMINAFQNGEDIHTATAAKVFNVPEDEVTREQRSNAKTVNFGIIYGVSAFGLSQQTNMTRTEAKEVIESYFNTYPGIKEYIDDQIQLAREKGYVETYFGRKRKLKDINSRNAVVRGHAERNAINAPIQGTAADVIKLAMIKIHQRMKEEKLASKMILQVHDELVFDVPKSEVEQLKLLLVEEMENAVKLSVPLKVDVGVGDNWLQAH